MEDIKIKSKKMSDTFEVRGIWSNSIEKLDNGISGILKYSPENITLELIGSITESLDLSEDNSFDGYIYGYTVRGEFITLYDCFCSNSESNFPGIKTEVYTVNSILVGGLHKKDEISFRNSYIYFSNLSEWLGKGIVNWNIINDMKHVYEIDRDKIERNLISINIPSIGLTIKEGYIITQKNYVDKIDVISDRYFRFTTDASESLKIQLENMHKIKQLISFLINGPIHVEKIEIVPEELKNWEGNSYNKNHTFSYFARQSISKKVLKWHEQLFTYNDISESIEEIFNNWILNYDNIGECYDLICTNLYQNKYDENMFLDFARAMEVFHRNVLEGAMKPNNDDKIDQCREELIKYINTNIDENYRDYFLDRILYEGEITFAKRIVNTLSELDEKIPNDIIKKKKKSIKKSINSFSIKVSKTRNYLTHKDNKKYDDSAVIKEPIKQLAVSYQMKIIVIILIGSYIGIDQTKLLEHISRSNIYRTMKMYM